MPPLSGLQILDSSSQLGAFLFPSATGLCALSASLFFLDTVRDEIKIPIEFCTIVNRGAINKFITLNTIKFYTSVLNVCG